MSDPQSSSANPFEDPIAAGHPLDILINAISGSDDYQIPPEAREGEFNLEQLLNSGDGSDGVAQKGKRKREDVTLDARQAKIARSVTSHIIQATTAQSDQSRLRKAQRYTPCTFSTIEVWHPTAGQKSYVKERRMLNPPPILRVTGPLLPLLTKATIQTVFTPTPDVAKSSTSLSAQTQRIPLVPLPPASPPRSLTGMKGKRLEKEEAKQKLRLQASRYGFGQTLPFERLKMAQKEREALSEGLSFPGLWVAEGIGRNKEFKLELDLGQPGMEDTSVKPSTPPEHADAQAAVDPQIIDDMAQDADPGIGPEAHRVPIDTPASGDLVTDNVPEIAPGQSIAQNEPTVQPTPSLNHLSAVHDSPIAGPSSTRDHAWAKFVSSPLAVVSKPSQKTAKARSMASCLTVDDSFALWVRIHGQTVRTKYMKVDASDNASLTTRTGQWTPFRFEVLDRAAASISLDRTAGGRKRSVVHATNILTYGSIGCLVDLQTGIKTEPMRLVRIDKNENLVGTDVGDPVSDLQRVGFIRLVDWQDDYTGGSRWYLSAPGARLGGAELHRPPKSVQSQTHDSDTQVEPIDTDPQTLGDVEVPDQPQKGKRKAKKVKTKRFALAEAVIAEDAGGAEFALSWTKADRAEGERARGFGKEAVKKVEMCEKVEDWMCWILGGVASFSYSFFDAAESTGGLPQGPVDPVPRSLLPPTFRPEVNTLELTMSDFFSNDSLGRAQKHEVYLGPIGPLHTATYRSTAPAESAANADTDTDGPQWEAVPYLDAHEGGSQLGSVRSNYPCNLPHVIVVVSMPRAEEIIRTMQECFAEAQYQATSTLHELPGEPTEAEGWLPTRETQESAVAVSSNPDIGRPQKEDAGQISEAQVPQPPADSLPQAELDLHRMFHAAQAGTETQHDVDDITAVLAAQATEADFSLANLEDQFINSNLDPTLHALETGPADSTPIENNTEAPGGPEQPSEAQEPAVDAISSADQPPPPPPALTLIRPDQESKKIEMVPLPLVIVRQSDGIGFGLGRSVVAERVDSKNAADKPRWGEPRISLLLMGDCGKANETGLRVVSD